ncbi:MAG: PilN domain-containing protein [Pseudomonadota bacterium]
MKRFNLMPKDAPYVENTPQPAVARTRDTDIIMVSLPIILALALIYFLHTSSRPDATSVTVNPVQQAKLESLKKEYDVLLNSTQTKSDIGKLLEERNRLKSNLDALRSLNLVKSVPLDLLVAIGKNISDKLALTAINKKESMVTLEGISMDNKSLSEFMDTLVVQNVFKTVSLKSSEYTDEFGPYKHKFSIAGIL